MKNLESVSKEQLALMPEYDPFQIAYNLHREVV